MLDRQSGKIVFECDACDQVLETETRDFSEAQATLRGENWVARSTKHIAGMADWSHFCPSCCRKGVPGS